MDTLHLVSDQLSVDLDPGRGADVVALTDRHTGTDVLFSTPWRARANAVRSKLSSPSTSDSFTGWLEQYRGGWQTLCPNAGPPRLVAGAPVGFHGEASVVRWDVTESNETSAKLRTELFSVPVAIERKVTVSGNTLTSVDTLRNLSSVSLEIDYASHPALGGAFLQGECTIDTGARRFISDPESHSTIAEPGSVHEWPWVTGPDGATIDMRKVPLPGEPRVAFGWLADFSDHWAAISNLDLALTVRLEWDGEYLPFAWLWQELNGSAGFPWFRRARVVAIEPSSTQTSGPERQSVLRLGPEQSIQIPVSITVDKTRRAES